MEEKKLTDEVVVAKNAITDEEIAKAILQSIEYSKTITYFDEWGNCKSIFMTDILDLIHRLQKENKELKSPKFASWKLKFFNLKEEFDKELAEHEEFTKEAKAEIERLKSMIASWEETWARAEEQHTKKRVTLTKENAELRKQVDELKEERENMQAVIFGLEEDKRLLQKQVDELKTENTELYKEHTTVIAGSILQKKQAVKDTAKEILDMLYTPMPKTNIVIEIKKRYGVEVE